MIVAVLEQVNFLSSSYTSIVVNFNVLSVTVRCIVLLTQHSECGFRFIYLLLPVQLSSASFSNFCSPSDRHASLVTAPSFAQGQLPLAYDYLDKSDEC